MTRARYVEEDALAMFGRFLKKSGWRLTAVAVAAIGAIVVVASVAAHGGDTTKIHSCVQKVSGNIRIVNPAEECRE